MQITFDTTTITDDEVRGIFALLDTVRPAAFDPGPFSESEMERAVSENLARSGLSVTKDQNGHTTVTVSAGQFVLPENVGEPFTVEGGELVPGTAAPTPPTTDSTGIVWDERIHASSKALNADGTWRTKRGVDKALVAQVEAELRQTVGLSAGDAPIVTNTETGETVLSAEQVTVPTPPAPPAPAAPLAPAPSPEPAESVPTSPAGVSPFVALMKRVTTAQGAGNLTQPRVKELLESLDKKSIMDLRTDDDALASFAVLLDGEGV